MRTVLAIAVAGLISGCALLQPRTDSAASLQPASGIDQGAVRRVATGAQPIALIPCERGAPLTKNCRRDSDAHFLFPEPMPDALETSNDIAVTTPVTDRRRK